MKEKFIQIIEGAKTVPASTWKFFIAFAVVVINMLLTHFGFNPLPFSESEVFIYASNFAVAFMTLYATWRNNSITPNAQTADKVLDALNNGEIALEDVEKLVK
jgi:SPP1 family holin